MLVKREKILTFRYHMIAVSILDIKQPWNMTIFGEIYALTVDSVEADDF